MIGIIAGSIIGSPYSKNNISHYENIFFPLFESTRKSFYYNASAPEDKRCLDSLEGLSRKEMSRYVYREQQFNPGVDPYCSFALELARGFAEGDFSDIAYGRQCNPLIAAAFCSLLDTQEQAIEQFNELLSVIEVDGTGVVWDDVLSVSERDACDAFLRLCWKASHGSSLKELLDFAEHDLGLKLSRGRDVMSNLLTGRFAQNVNYPDLETFVIGDGKSLLHGRDLVSAVVETVFHCTSWEESVRRAVALGGHSSLVGGLAGFLAEFVHGNIPEHIVNRSKDFLSQMDKESLKLFEVALSKESEKKVEKVVALDKCEIIKCGSEVVYLIPESRKDMRNAALRLCRQSGRDFVCHDPAEKQRVLDDFSERSLSAVRQLGDTYMERALPEVKVTYFSKGKFYTSSTLVSDDLPSREKRLEAFNEFEKLKTYANEVRSRLEAFVGHDGTKGRHIHFASAFYPVVYDRMIDLMQGDVLRGRVQLGEDGLIHVNSNVHTGSLQGEYLSGALNSVDIFHKNMNVAEIKSVLDQYCLDFGLIPDDSARSLLEGEDLDASAMKEVYKSNVERAVEDMSLCRDELLEDSVSFSSDDIDRAIAESSFLAREKAAESGRVLEGDYKDIIWSKCHQGSVFTVGHSNMSFDELAALMKRFGIDEVIDIRSYPVSKFCPQFNGGDPYKGKASVLESSFDGLGINYEWYGDVFGGHMYADADKSSVMTYDEVLSTARAKENLKVIRDLVKSGSRIVLLCSESAPSACHRFAMMGYALEHPEDGRVKPIPVQHILRNGQLVSQEVLEKKMMRSYGMSDGKGTLKEAYAKKCHDLLSKSKNDNRISVRRRR